MDAPPDAPKRAGAWRNAAAAELSGRATASDEAGLRASRTAPSRPVGRRAPASCGARAPLRARLSRRAQAWWARLVREVQAPQRPSAQEAARSRVERAWPSACRLLHQAPRRGLAAPDARRRPPRDPPRDGPDQRHVRRRRRRIPSVRGAGPGLQALHHPRLPLGDRRNPASGVRPMRLEDITARDIERWRERALVAPSRRGDRSPTRARTTTWFCCMRSSAVP